MGKDEAAFKEFVEGMPDQTGKLALITGATSSIRLEAAKVLAAKGADVVIASRETVTRMTHSRPDSRDGCSAGSVNQRRMARCPCFTHSRAKTQRTVVITAHRASESGRGFQV